MDMSEQALTAATESVLEGLRACNRVAFYNGLQKIGQFTFESAKIESAGASFTITIQSPISTTSVFTSVALMRGFDELMRASSINAGRLKRGTFLVLRYWMFSFGGGST